MELLGGFLVDGVLRQDCAFRPVTGTVELAVAEAGVASAPWPVRVTRVLVSALEHLCGGEPTWERVHALCVGDRQYLVRQLAGHLGRDSVWLTGRCTACAEPFDFQVDQSKLPAKPASAGYPFVTVDTSVGPVRVRVPTGADQAAVAALPQEADPRLALIGHILVEPRHIEAEALHEHDLHAIETALGEIAPEVTTRVQLACPSCTRINEIEIDPYMCMLQRADELYSDIHLLAGYYHWSEREILAMPRARRHTYLRYVDRARGMTQ